MIFLETIKQIRINGTKCWIKTDTQYFSFGEWETLHHINYISNKYLQMMMMIRWKYALHMSSVNTTLLVPCTFAVSFILGCSSRIKRDRSDWLLVFYCPLVVKVCQPRILIKTTYPACKPAIHPSHWHTRFSRCKAVASNACSVFTLSLSATTDPDVQYSYFWSATVQTARGAFANRGVFELFFFFTAKKKKKKLCCPAFNTRKYQGDTNLPQLKLHIKWIMWIVWSKSFKIWV